MAWLACCASQEARRHKVFSIPVAPPCNSPLPSALLLPCLQLVGGPGTAKTSTVQQFLGGFSKDDHLSKTITFSYLTTPQLFQQSMESTVEKRQGGGISEAGRGWGLKHVMVVVCV